MPSPPPLPSSVSPKLGFRIAATPPRLPDALVERFRGIAAANVADAMGRFNFMDPGIVSRTGLSVCGRAVTVRCRPADNLMVHKALQIADPGDVIVVATCGNTTSAVFGELMCHTAAAKKIGGIVVDGAIRDVDGIRRLGMPAFSRSVSPGACDKDGPGEINLPIACGDTVVMPGDLVIGDKDGVSIVPRDDAEAVLVLVGELMARETARIAEIGRGVLYRPEIDESLRKKGVIE
jgi:4-hydroxy-4-methyl-2-oxoglutarate aldolase